MKYPTHKRIAGLSLMETMVIIGIMAVIMSMVTQIMILNYSIFETQIRRSENETGAIMVAKTISQMTRGASSVEPSHLFGTDTHTSSTNSLVLKLPAIGDTGMILEGVYDYIAFYRDSVETGKIMAVTDADDLSIRSDSTRMITDHNQTMRFRYDDPNVSDAERVSIYVMNQQTYRDTTIKTRGWTSIFLRN